MRQLLSLGGFAGMVAVPLAVALCGIVIVLSCRSGGGVTLDGEWAGGYRMGEQWTFARLRFKPTDRGMEGTADLPYDFAAGMPITGIVAARDDVRFDLGLASGPLRFDGRLDAQMLSGEVTRGSERGQFQLFHVAAVDRALLNDYTGVYRSAGDGPVAGRLFYVQTWDELGSGQLALFDEGGEIRSLYPLSATDFVTGPAMSFPVPVEARYRFERGSGGAVSGVTVRVAGRPDAIAEKIVLYDETEIRFRAGGVTLAGTLRTPLTKGPHPAVVLLHGSGPQDRGSLLPFTWFLLRHGVALFGYDKRGVGASEGDWRRAGFDLLAGDALAAVAALKMRDDIDAGRIGAFGVSQGGWIGPLAAARSTDVAFVISVSGPGVTPAEETMDYAEREMRAWGFPDAEIAQMLALRRLSDDYARTGRGWERVQAAVEAARRKEWFFPALAPPRDDWFWDMWRRILDYDPAPALGRLRCPVLAIFGGLDQNVVAAKNRARWEEALRRGGNRDATLLTLPKANHAMAEAVTGTTAEFPRLRRFVPDYITTLVEWVGRTVAR